MEKKNKSAITITFLIIGGFFLLISAFMLVTAIIYTKNYLQSYDASFADMWSNSLQYIITQFGPYLGFGVISIGIGKAIKGMKSPSKIEGSSGDDELAKQVEYLAKEIDTTREVLCIKIEEKEKRDSFRMAELGRKLGLEKSTPAEGPLKEVGEYTDLVPEIIREVSDSMTMPEIPEIQRTPLTSKKTSSVPEIMRHAGIMAIPDIPGIPCQTEQ